MQGFVAKIRSAKIFSGASGGKVCTHRNFPLYGIKYLDRGVLPTDEKLAKRLVLEHSLFTIQDDVLFYVDVARENSLRVAVPSNSQRKLLEEVHGCKPSGHFAAKSMYNILARRYLWDRMYGDVHCYCRACLTCASVLVISTELHGNPFLFLGRVGVDIMKMPLGTPLRDSLRGLSYEVGGGLCH